MKILKVINNNVVSASDDKGKEIVVMGKGLGFGKKNGDILDESKIEKKFSMPDESVSRLEEILKDIPYEYAQVANRIIAMVKEKFDMKLSKIIYITLTDHLNFAITRFKKGIKVENALLWEIKRFYQKEFEAGKEALEIIKKELGIELSEDEAGFFAIHILNAQIDADMMQTINIPGITKDIVNIVGYTFGRELDRESLYYERFITHLKHFLARVVKNETYGEDANDRLAIMVKDEFPKSYRCALRIRDYLKVSRKYNVSLEEISYLTIHIQRLSGEGQKNIHKES